eukprot:6889469-Alexandrium_andersonii.AAC.1
MAPRAHTLITCSAHLRTAPRAHTLIACLTHPRTLALGEFDTCTHTCHTHRHTHTLTKDWETLASPPVGHAFRLAWHSSWA